MNISLLEQIVQETYNTEFRISFNGKEWSVYIVKSKTLFTGLFKDVIELAIEEFESYRVLSNDRIGVKNYKKYRY